MRKLILSLASALLVLSTPLAAQEMGPPPKLSQEEVDAANTAAARGVMIFRHDRAAWVTTDTMLEALSRKQLSTIRGWVVVDVDDGLRVTYYARDGDIPAAVYSATLAGDGVKDETIHTSDNNSLSPEQIELANALQAVDLAGLSMCSDQRPNIVTLPPESEGAPVLLYVMTPQPAIGAVQNGGHHRFSVLDGQVVEQRAFANSCMQLGGQQTDENGDPMEGNVAFVSHILDTTPTEMHMFNTMAMGVPLVVMTIDNKALWQVSAQDGEAGIIPVGTLPEQ